MIEILIDYMPVFMFSGFFIFFGFMIWLVQKNKKWLVKNSPLDWSIFGQQKNIVVSNLMNYPNIIILQDAEDIFTCLIICDEVNGIWEYKYTFEKKLKKYIFKGHKITFYDKTSRKNNKGISTGYYLSD